MGKLAAAGWILALAIAGVSYAAYEWLLTERETALAAQATEYEARLAKLKSETDALVQTTKDEAVAKEQVIQAELDFEKLPDLPLKFAFRTNQVLYVESESPEVFYCKVYLTRPSTGATVVLDFSINPHAFKDLAAMERWVFERGDKIEFRKPGSKIWSGEFP